MTYGTPMHHCPDGPALTSDSSKRRWATHRSPSPRTPTRTCLTMSLTTSPPRSTRSTTPLAQLAADPSLAPFWPHSVRFLRGRRAAKTGLQHLDLHKQPCGQGRDRTGDLPLFRRTLIPTELPGRKAPMSNPSASPNTGDPDGT